jgi:hypothetical protein
MVYIIKKQLDDDRGVAILIIQRAYAKSTRYGLVVRKARYAVGGNAFALISIRYYYSGMGIKN